MEYMNKSKRHRRGNWWQNISTSSKVFCIVGAVIVTVILLTYYFVSMASGPEVVAKVVIAVSILGITIFIVTFVVCSAIDRARIGAVQNDTVELLRQMILQESIKIQQLNERDDWWEEIDLDMEPEERLAKTVKPTVKESELQCLSKEELAALWAEINSFDYDAEVEGIRQRKFEREIKQKKEQAEQIRATNPDEAAKIDAEIATMLQVEKIFIESKSAVKAEDKSRFKATEDENNTEHEDKLAEDTGDDKHEDKAPTSKKVVSIFGHSVKAKTTATSGGSDEKPVKEENPDEGQPPTQLHVEPEEKPDSPENQPEEPKKCLSAREQAEARGISPSYLQYKLCMAGVTDYDALSDKDKEDIEEFKKRGSSYAVNL